MAHPLSCPPPATPSSRRERPPRREAGVVFIWIVVSFFVLAVFLVAAVQPASIVMRREKEKELVFRGQSYVEAIRLYQAEHGGAFPTQMKQLVEQGPQKHHYIRRLYTNPFDLEGKWILLTPGTTTVTQNEKGEPVYKTAGQGVNTGGISSGGVATGLGGPAPGGGPTGPGGTGPGGGPTPGGLLPPGVTTMTLPFRIGGEDGQPILGVFCKRHEKAFQDLRGKDYYDQWFFSPLVMPPPALPMPGPSGVGSQTQPGGGTGPGTGGGVGGGTGGGVGGGTGGGTKGG